MMKNTLKAIRSIAAMRNIAGIIALFAIIGFSMTALSLTGCDLDGNNNTHTCSFSTTWSSNATTHYKQCSCGEKIDVENHVGNPCSVCGYNSSGSSSHSLDGLWETTSGGWQTTFNGNSGVIANLGSTPSALTLDAINKGYLAIGTQEYRNLTSSGNLTWTGQSIGVSYNSSNPNVATGTQWVNCTIAMNADGQTIQVTFVYASGGTTTNYTRKR